MVGPVSEPFSGAMLSLPNGVCTMPSAAVPATMFASPRNWAMVGSSGMVVEGFGGGELADPAVVDDPDQVGDRERLGLVVGDEDRWWRAGRAGSASRRSAATSAGSASREENGSSSSTSRGSGSEGSGERDPLLLAAGELVRVALAQTAQSDQVEQLFDPPELRSRRGSPKAMFLATVRWGKRLPSWATKPIRRLVGGHEPCGRVDDLAIEGDRPGVGSVEAGDQAQQGRLAAAGLPEHGDDRPVGDFEVEAVEHRGCTERLVMAWQAIVLTSAPPGSIRCPGR